MAAEADRHFRETYPGDLSGLYHILGLRPLGSLASFICNGITLVQGLESIASDGGEVNKQIISPVVRSNKTETL